MPPIMCWIGVTWISNFFLRDLPTSMGVGGVIVTIQDVTPDIRCVGLHAATGLTSDHHIL